MAKTLFEHLNQIYEKQNLDYFDILEDSDRKSFNVWMVNRFISMNPDYLPVVNELQKYWDVVKARDVYLFYSQVLPKKKQFNKYIKSAKDSPHEEWVIEKVCKKFEISQSEAEGYLRILYAFSSGREYLKELLAGFGHSEKEMKKVGL